MNEAKTTLTELIEQEQARQADRNDLLVDNRRFTMDDAGDIAVDNFGSKTYYHLTEHCHLQMASKIGIAQNYYAKMLREDKSLLAQNVNRWLRSADKSTEFIFRTENDRGLAFVSNRFRPIDNLDVLQHLQSRMSDLEITRSSFTDTHMRIDFVNSDTNTLIDSATKNDYVQSGIELSNSEVGVGYLSIANFVLRLVCTNGMTVRERDSEIRRKHVGEVYKLADLGGFGVMPIIYKPFDDADFWNKAGSKVTQALGSESQTSVIQQLQDATKRYLKTTDQRLMIDNLSGLLSFTKTESDLVYDYFLKEPTDTLYDLGNAVTRTAQDLTPARRAEFEGKGFEVFSLSDRSFERLIDTQQD